MMTKPEEKIVLIFDDTGSRNPEQNSNSRSDGMDCFGLGGILIKGEDVSKVIDAHKDFCTSLKIDYPLHSTKIRGKRDEFVWLQQETVPSEFLSDLQRFIVAQPIIGTACVIDRKGYVSRYAHLHQEQLWLMCKTAFCILVERSAKYAERQGRRLEIFFEQTGKKEDRNIISYMKELKQTGNPFGNVTSGGYAPLSADGYNRLVLGEPTRRTKEFSLLQIADLILYPIAKGGYDPNYKPYLVLREKKKLIDCLLPEQDRVALGIKYSCF